MAAATATKHENTSGALPPVTTVDVVLVLKDRTLSVKDLLKEVDILDVSEAWGAGDIQFGHRNYNTQTGGRDERGRDVKSRLTVESGWDWTGAKSEDRVGFVEIWAEWENFPGTFDEYRFYPPASKIVAPEGEPEKSPLQEITREKAQELLALQVKLTNSGMKRLRELRRKQ